MKLGDGLAYVFKRGSCGFDYQKGLAGLFDAALPAVNRCDLRDNVDAGGQAPFHQMVRDHLSFFLRAGGSENDSLVGHMKSAFSGQRETNQCGETSTSRLFTRGNSF